MEAALLHVPSAFNSQSARLVLLLGEQHDGLWQIVKDTLRPLVPADAFVKTEEKIDQAFASGYGTVLFYEDQDTVKQLQEQFPLYKDNFPTFSEHSTAMHQFAVWTMLEDAGLIVMNKAGGAVQIHMTEVGREVAGQLRMLESVLSSSTVRGVKD